MAIAAVLEAYKRADSQNEVLLRAIRPQSSKEEKGGDCEPTDVKHSSGEEK